MADETNEAIQPAALGLSLTGKPLPEFAEPISAPHGTTPLRRPNSVRRTMSIDVRWPDGPTAAGHFLGTARDIFTPAAGGDPIVLGEAEARVVAADRQIVSISSTPTPPHLQDLVGVRAGGHLRNALALAVPEEKAAGTPLYLVLDDMAGSTLVAKWAFSRWTEDWMERMQPANPRPQMEGVCIGFRPGASSLGADGRPLPSQNTSRVVPLRNPADPLGWHDLPDYDGVNFRRARRIDVWRDGGELAVEALFQDSASAPDGGNRFSIHEYLLEARIGADGLIRSLVATPGTLPYSTCRAAPTNNEVLIGTPARELRDLVLEKLKFTGGCTHLNDTLRSLAEVEVMARALAG